MITSTETQTIITIERREGNWFFIGSNHRFDTCVVPVTRQLVFAYLGFWYMCDRSDSRMPVNCQPELVQHDTYLGSFTTYLSLWRLERVLTKQKNQSGVKRSISRRLEKGGRQSQVIRQAVHAPICHRSQGDPHMTRPEHYRYRLANRNVDGEQTGSSFHLFHLFTGTYS